MTYLAGEREQLDLSGLPAILDDFRREGVEAVAICLLHAYANPEHERRLAAAVAAAWPGIPVVASHQITREWREYERTNTTVLSAYVQPIAARYLAGPEAGARRARLPGSAVRHAIELRGRLRRTHQRGAHRHGGIGAGQRLLGSGGVRTATRHSQRTCARYRRHHREVQPHRKRPRQDHDGLLDRAYAHLGRPIPSWYRWWIWSKSATAAAASRGSTSSTNYAWGRGRRAPRPVRRRTVVADGAPPPRMRTWRSGASNPGFFCGGSIEADLPAVANALDELAGPLGMTRQEVARGIVRIAN